MGILVLLRMTLLARTGFVRGLTIDIERDGEIVQDYVDVVITMCDPDVTRSRCEALALDNGYEGR